MRELGRLVRRIADEAADIPALNARAWLESRPWPAGRAADEGALAVKIKALLERRLGERGVVELAREAASLAAHLEQLAEAEAEARQHEHERQGMASRAQLRGQAGAVETRLDLHRQRALLAERAGVRAQVQRAQIDARLEGRDPFAASRALLDRERALDLERLEQIRDSGELRPGLELELEAARASLAGEEARAAELRGLAQAAYRRFVALSRLGEVARLGPTAERTAAGLGPDTAPLSPRLRADLEQLQRCAEGRAVFVSGSTHPGDEQAITRALRRALRRGDPPLLHIVVPRRPPRALRLRLELATGHGPVRLLRTPVSPRRGAPRFARGSTPDLELVLVNLVGLLEAAYGLADGAFVGGSLHALRNHNFCEPLAHGVLTHVGPFHGAHPERWALIRRQAPELVEEVHTEDLDAMAARFVARVRGGLTREERRQRAARFLDVSRDVERSALAALEELGAAQIEWLERIEAEGRPAWLACPCREALLRSGTVVLAPPMIAAPGLRHLDGLLRVPRVRVTRAARYLLRRRAAAGRASARQGPSPRGR